jgi:hypothetical protein
MVMCTCFKPSIAGGRGLHRQDFANDIRERRITATTPKKPRMHTAQDSGKLGKKRE